MNGDSLAVDIARLADSLQGSELGRVIVHFSNIHSTNTVARAMAERGIPHGSIVIADFQTGGHGRMGRRWVADAGSCLLASIVLRPKLDPADVFYLTMIPALAVLDLCSQLGVRNATLKWPNDVHVAGGKVAGILTELSLRGTLLDYVVVGIGLNVNLDVHAHAEIARLATSLSAVLGRTLETRDVTLGFLVAFGERYQSLTCGETGKIFTDWRAALNTIGHWVDINDGVTAYRAFAEDVTPDGGLVLRRDGQRKVVYGGDVTLAPTSY